ncbi:hypothetical protein F5B21DRAFT_88019 [Xylaria acuta]|nr:hypothetical protein F5B21DRAFT_88019 [Xylaria acuta]
MALTQRHRDKPIPRPTTRRFTRPSSSLRTTAAAATPVKIQAQESLNHKASGRRSRSTATGEIGPNGDSISHHHHARQLALPQRSSLRLALHESLKLPDGTTHHSVLSSKDPGTSLRYPAITLGPPDTMQAELEVFAQSGNQTRRVHSRTATTNPNDTWLIGPANSSALSLRPQRSSLRRAIRYSLAAIDIRGGSSVPPANYTKSQPVQSLLPGLVPGFETRHQALDGRNGQVCTRQSSHPKARAVSHAIPQQSSLRRAVRESRYVAVRSIERADATSYGISPSRNSMNTIDKPSSSSDGGNGGAISPSGFSPAIDSDTSETLEGQIFEIPSQITHTSCVSPRTTYPVPNLNSESSSPKSARHQNPHLVFLDRSIRNDEKPRSDPSDSQSTSNRKGWHHVHEIINEAPRGLCLVEWEERDTRAGFMWPASWVCSPHFTDYRLPFVYRTQPYVSFVIIGSFAMLTFLLR